MKVPTTIRINGRQWRIVRAPLPTDHGLTDHRTRTVTLDTALTGEDLKDTLLHELLHACLGEESGFYLSSNKEELMIRLLAPRLLGVLKQIRSWK